MRLSFSILGTSIAVAAALTSTAAFADGYRGRPVYAVPPIASWTGFYIGGNVGGAWSDVEWSNISLTGDRFNEGASGFIAGGQIGYNQQFGNIVLGVEATLSGADLSRDHTSILVPTETSEPMSIRSRP